MKYAAPRVTPRALPQGRCRTPRYAALTGLPDCVAADTRHWFLPPVMFCPPAGAAGRPAAPWRQWVRCSPALTRRHPERRLPRLPGSEVAAVGDARGSLTTHRRLGQLFARHTERASLEGARQPGRRAKCRRNAAHSRKRTRDAGSRGRRRCPRVQPRAERPRQHPGGTRHVKRRGKFARLHERP